MHRVSKRTWRTETSQYPQEKKETSIPLVAASEDGTAQTGIRPGVAGADMVHPNQLGTVLKGGPKKVPVLYQQMKVA